MPAHAKPDPGKALLKPTDHMLMRRFGGYAAWADPDGAGGPVLRRKAAMRCGCANSCGVHGHDHAAAWSSKLPISDLKGFRGALGCSRRAV